MKSSNLLFKKGDLVSYATERYRNFRSRVGLVIDVIIPLPSAAIYIPGEDFELLVLWNFGKCGWYHEKELIKIQCSDLAI
jgi:hypothetical protein